VEKALHWTERLFHAAVGEEDGRLCKDISEAACHDQPRSFVIQTAAMGLSKIGDGLADSKVVLPWLLGALGAPAFFVGLLVPIRESLSLLPQLLVGGLIRSFPRRKHFWAFASAVEGLCILAMAMAGMAGLEGFSAGVAVIALLAVFSLARGVASVAAKDVLGKTVAKAKRGRLSGYAESIAGAVTGLVGIYLTLVPEDQRSDGLLFAIIAAAGVSWLLGAVTFLMLDEEEGATEGGRDLKSVLTGQIDLLFADAELRRFLWARSLLLSTAFAGPIYVAFAQQGTDGSLATLGLLVVATGLAGTLSSAVWGGLSDRSSRRTMTYAAVGAGLLGAVVLAIHIALPQVLGSLWFHGAVLFVLGVSHSGVRIGRKTQLIDMTTAETRAQYVALSNSLIGVVLLGSGVVIGLVMSWSLLMALAILTLGAFAAAFACWRLEEAQQD
jgi:MFS family permease